MTTNIQHPSNVSEPTGNSRDDGQQPVDAQPTSHAALPPASPVRLARVAGVLYLVVAILGAFAQAVRVSVYVPGDGAATAANLVAHASLVRASFAADLIQALVWVIMA